MIVETEIRYEERYLPTKRHRIPRIRTVKEVIPVELREESMDNAPVAMIVTDYMSFVDHDGNEKFGLRNSKFHLIGKELYSERRDMWGALDKGAYSMELFLSELNRIGDCLCSWNANKRSKEDMICSINDFLKSHVIIDGIIYRQTNEPRYVVQTFGLGHNHGGTALMISKHYNENIGKNCYFNALQRDEAISYANMVALRRGDTKDVGRFGDRKIEVLIQEAVKCNPNIEHGDGCEFINSIEDIVRNSESAEEAGLLSIMNLMN